MNRYTVAIRRRADSDATRAAQWHEEQRPGLGGEFLDEFVSTCDRICRDPLIHPIANRQRGIRKILFNRFPYLIYFTVEDAEVIIHAVLHAHRSPRIWKSRFE